MSNEKEWTFTGFWLPIEVVINPFLSQTEKIIYGIIKSLSGRKEGCTASNKYFASLTFTKEQTVSNSIRTLVDYGYIITEYNKQNIPNRRIFINPKSEEIYREAIHFFNDNFKEFETDLNITNQFETTIKKLIDLYKKNYNIYNSNITVSEETVFSSIEENTFPLETEVCAPRIRSQIRSLITQEKETKKKERVTQEFDNSLCNIEAIISFWNEQKGIPVHKPGTQTYKDIVKKVQKLMNGTLFNSLPKYAKYKNHRFTRAEIIDTIKKHTLCVTSADYLPEDKKVLRSTSLSTFLLCEFKSYSSFLFRYENEPRLVKAKKVELIKSSDKFPDITKIIYDWYVKTFGTKDFTPAQIQDFVTASVKINAFAVKWESKFYDLHHWINMYDCENSQQLFAKLEIEMFEEYLRKTSNKFHTGYLSSDKTYSDFFVKYLKETAYI